MDCCFSFQPNELTRNLKCYNILAPLNDQRLVKSFKILDKYLYAKFKRFLIQTNLPKNIYIIRGPYTCGGPGDFGKYKEVT